MHPCLKAFRRHTLPVLAARNFKVLALKARGNDTRTVIKTIGRNGDHVLECRPAARLQV